LLYFSKIHIRYTFILTNFFCSCSIDHNFTAFTICRWFSFDKWYTLPLRFVGLTLVKVYLIPSKLMKLVSVLQMYKISVFFPRYSDFLPQSNWLSLNYMHTWLIDGFTCLIHNFIYRWIVYSYITCLVRLDQISIFCVLFIPFDDVHRV
jgi:hypothetical protein